MQVVEPRVYTACKFFAKTFFFANLFAVNVRAMVTYNNRPLGTLATVIPIESPKAVIIPKLRAKLTTKTIIPKEIAKNPKRRTNLLIYF